MISEAGPLPGAETVSFRTARRALILLATRNGEAWLDEQLRSIFEQRDVLVSIAASDDGSTDGTRRTLRKWARLKPLGLLPGQAPLGGAARNFLHLIREAPLEDASFVAFADQDDIWEPTKITRAIEFIERFGLDAYSSDVTAFWPDGTRRRIRKAQPLRKHDHLFESAGPGCTFVFTRVAFLRLRAWVTENSGRLLNPPIHDWLIYAYARTHGWKWHIDDWTSVQYRQHARNEIGANAGLVAARRRLQRVRSGAFRSDVLAVADAVDDSSWVAEAMRRLWIRDRLALLCRAGDLRRRPRDRWLLALLLLLMR